MSTYKIDYGGAVIECGLFLRRVDRPAIKAKAYQEARGRPLAHLSTWEDRSTIKETILEILQQACKHVFFTSFLIQDDDVTQALIAAAQRLNGHVYVLTTLKNQDFDALYAEKNDGDDEGWSFQDHIRHIAALTASGIFVKARKDCHAKFVVVDGTCAVITSANAAPTCYVNIDRPDGTRRPANAENGVFLTIPGEVVRLGNFFRAIWRSGSNYYVSPDAKVFEVGQHTDEIVTIQCAEPRERDAQGEVLWTAPGDARIRDALIAMVGQAQSKIHISSMFIEGMEDHALGEALTAAAKRGVETEIILRRTRKPERLKSCYSLKRAMRDRLTLFGDCYNHSKAVLIDNTSAIVMTANLDADHGLDHGVEVAFRSPDKRFAKAVSAFLDRLQAQAHLEFVADPTQAQAAARWPGPPTTGLAERLHLQIGLKGQPANGERTTEDFLTALRTELVYVRDDRPQGQEPQLLLATSTLVARCHRHSPEQLTILRIEDNNARRVPPGPGSLLPRTEITVTTN
jgi:phosphatidylserine/phosphatidylglycerophosphate/cardiolipin synthase-like enzyme